MVPEKYVMKEYWRRLLVGKPLMQAVEWWVEEGMVQKQLEKKVENPFEEEQERLQKLKMVQESLRDCETPGLEEASPGSRQWRYPPPVGRRRQRDLEDLTALCPPFGSLLTLSYLCRHH